MLQIKNKAIKENTKGTEVWKLWSIPIVIFVLGFILLKVA
jgi:cytochrome c-type biogenesis protein CcmH/NrfF